jgi:hypothetical protein
MEVIFTFRTPGEAVKGEAALDAAGLAVKVMPRPPVLGAGCGLCLRLPEAEVAPGLRLLAALGLTPEGLYDRLETEGASCYRSRGRDF